MWSSIAATAVAQAFPVVHRSKSELANVNDAVVCAGRRRDNGDRHGGLRLSRLGTMGEAEQVVREFFARYAEGLLRRDAEVVADMYAVPALIAFPGRTIAVSERTQTRDFFAAGWGAYEGVDEADPRVIVVAQTGHSVWADVTWSYGGQPRERYIYQLLNGPSGWQIAVLTPLDM